MKTRRGLARAAGLISGATMLSRLLGLAREQLLAALMGASMFADAFILAFRIPNLLRDLFAEGALAQAFVPTFKSELNHHGPERAHLLANRVAGTLVTVIAIIVLLGGLFTPQIVDSLAGGYAEVPGKFELTVLLTRIMLPFLPIVSLAAVAMGMLNAREHYATPALAPAMFNLAAIATGAGLWLCGVHGRAAAIGWSIGTVAGGLAQLGIQLPPLWRLGFRPRLRPDLRLRDRGTRTVARLMGPAVIGLAAVQINVYVNTLFAATEPSAVSWLNYAFRFLQLPIGVFGVAVATVATTRFADSAASADRTQIAKQMAQALRLVVFLTVPAMVGLVVMGEPIIQLVYERGRFGPRDTAAVTSALELYAVGLVAYAAVKVVAPAFYAVGRARVPMVASVSAVAANVTLNVVLHPVYGFRILALGVSIAALFNFAVLYGMFQRVVAKVNHLQIIGHALRVAAAAAAMGALVWATHDAMLAWVGDDSLAARLLRTLVPITVGVLGYAGACLVLRIPELGELRRRLGRRRG
jgi:putative peptidoglycan lipid II flippase